MLNRSNIASVTIGAIAAGCVGFFFTALLPDKYITQATIRLATITENGRQITLAQPREVLEMLRSPDFYDDAIRDACKTTSSDSISNNLSGKAVKGTNFISLSYDHKESLDGINCLQSIISKLSRQQEELRQPLLTVKSKLLDDVKKYFLEKKQFDFKYSNLTNQMHDGQDEIKKTRLEAIKLVSEIETEAMKPFTSELTTIIQPSTRSEKNGSKVMIVVISTLAGGAIGLLINYLLPKRRKTIEFN